jgi:fluoride exporter
MTGTEWLLVALGGAFGAMARYVVDTAVSRRRSSAFPLGTLLINISGAALLGAIAATASSDGLTYAAVGAGFCGGFTTFSTFAWETVALAEDGFPGAAAMNVVLSLVLGVGAASLTYWAL